MYAVLTADSEENLRELLKEFNTDRKKRKLKVNTGQIKVVVCEKTERRDRLNVEGLEVIDSQVPWTHHQRQE